MLISSELLGVFTGRISAPNRSEYAAIDAGGEYLTQTAVSVPRLHAPVEYLGPCREVGAGSGR
jgi:hypothetical protein